MKKVVFLKKQKSLESKKSDFVKQAERSRFVGATKAKDLLSLLGAGVAPAFIYYKYVFVGGGVCVCVCSCLHLLQAWLPRSIWLVTARYRVSDLPWSNAAGMLFLAMIIRSKTSTYRCSIPHFIRCWRHTTGERCCLHTLLVPEGFGWPVCETGC